MLAMIITVFGSSLQLQPTVFLSHIAPASSHQPGNSVFLSHNSTSSLPNAVRAWARACACCRLGARDWISLGARVEMDLLL